jgi:hypothetical protein
MHSKLRLKLAVESFATLQFQDPDRSNVLNRCSHIDRVQWVDSIKLAVFHTMLPLVANTPGVTVEDLQAICSQDAWLLDKVQESDTHFAATIDVDSNCLNMSPEGFRNVAQALSVAMGSAPIVADIFEHFVSIKTVGERLGAMPSEDASLMVVGAVSAIWRLVKSCEVYCGSEPRASTINIQKLAVLVVYITFGSYAAESASEEAGVACPVYSSVARFPQPQAWEGYRF